MPIIGKKMNGTIISREINKIGQKYPNLTPVVLYDQYTDMPTGFQAISCSQVSTEILAGYNLEQTIFVYACEQDDVGLPFIEYIIRHGGMFEPVFCSQPSNYANINKLARDGLEAEYEYQAANKFGKWDYGYGDFGQFGPSFRGDKIADGSIC